jgi:hypothetical protein
MKTNKKLRKNSRVLKLKGVLLQVDDRAVGVTLISFLRNWEVTGDISNCFTVAAQSKGLSGFFV